MPRILFAVFAIALLISGPEALARRPAAAATKKPAAAKPAPTAPTAYGTGASFAPSAASDPLYDSSWADEDQTVGYETKARTQKRYKLGSLRYFTPQDGFTLNFGYRTPLEQKYSFKSPGSGGILVSTDTYTSGTALFAGEYGLAPNLAIGLELDYLIVQTRTTQNVSPNRTQRAKSYGFSDPMLTGRYRVLENSPELKGATGDVGLKVRLPVQDYKADEYGREGNNGNTGAWEVATEGKLIWSRGKHSFGPRLGLTYFGSRKREASDERNTLNYESYFQAELEAMYAYIPTPRVVLRPLLSLVTGHELTATYDVRSPLVTVAQDIPIHFEYGFEVNYEAWARKNLFARVQGVSYGGEFDTRTGGGSTRTPYDYKRWYLTLGMNWELN